MDTSLVQAGHGRAFRLAPGEQLEVATPQGSQVADTWALTVPELDEWMSMEHTRALTGRLTPRVGDLLYSNRRRGLLRLTADTSPGTHDTLFPACDAERYAQLGHRGPHRSCCDNFREAVTATGFRPPPVPSPLNLFMNVPLSADLELELAPSPAGPGDSVSLEALVDVVVVVSACPQDLVPINGTSMRPTELQVRHPPQR